MAAQSQRRWLTQGKGCRISIVTATIRKMIARTAGSDGWVAGPFDEVMPRLDNDTGRGYRLAVHLLARYLLSQDTCDDLDVSIWPGASQFEEPLLVRLMETGRATELCFSPQSLTVPFIQKLLGAAEAASSRLRVLDLSPRPFQ